MGGFCAFWLFLGISCIWSSLAGKIELGELFMGFFMLTLSPFLVYQRLKTGRWPSKASGSGAIGGGCGSSCGGGCGGGG